MGLPGDTVSGGVNVGLFDLFKKKKKQEPELPQPASEIHVVPKIQNNSIKPPVSETALVSTKAEKQQISIHSSFTLHEDIKNLLWIADGKYQNFTKDMYDDGKEHIFIDGLHFVIGYNADEPSLIYTKQPISKPSDESVIMRPPYFPTYSGLSAEQRWIYLKLLSNPYNTEIDIGYVFILYYGLERQMLHGNFEDAFKVILKLRDVHKNKSFQSYSARAIILTSMLQKKGESALEFINSLDKEYEFDFSDNLFLILYYSFDIPLLPKDIMRMAKTFEFTNTNYIKKNPDIFVNCLAEAMEKETGKKTISIKQYVTNTELSKIRNEKACIFANVSIVTNTVPVPMLSENFKLKKAINAFLETAHEKTKAKVAELRKAGKLASEPPSPTNPKKGEPVKPVEEKTALAQDFILDKSDVIIKRHKFDRSKIPQGPFTNNDFSVDKNPIIRKHIECSELVRFSYANRNEGIDFLKEAVKACKKQISISAEAAYWIYAENEYRRERIEREYGMSPIEHFRKIRAERGLPPPEDGYDPCGMPEHLGYKQLCIICEKQGFWDEIINIAEQAKEEGWRGDWDKRIAKAKKKLEQGK
jgi:hypothetical protein